MPLYPFEDQSPVVDPTAWVAPGAQVAGDVVIGPESSIWYNCVLRADVCHIRIGARSNIQDGTVIHVNTGGPGTIIGDDVLVGHMVMLHGCTLEDRSFVGLGSIVMDGCVIEEEGMLGAGSLLSPNKRIGKRELWLGRPARLVRVMEEDEVKRLAFGAKGYVELAKRHKASIAAQQATQAD